MDFKDEWDKSPSTTEFPLKFSETDVEEIEKDVQNAANAIELMNKIKERLENFWPERGLTEENYEVVMSQLKSIKSDLMDAFVKSEDGKKVFEKYWPFDC